MMYKGRIMIEVNKETYYEILKWSSPEERWVYLEIDDKYPTHVSINDSRFVFWCKTN